MNIEVSEQEAQVLLAGIAELPLKVSVEVFQKVQGQVLKQMESAKQPAAPKVVTKAK